MTGQGFALFDTAVGRCGVVWGGRGIVGVQLPEARDLSGIALAMEAMPPFHRRVYEAARAVGQALGRNPFAIIVPCHRALAAGGKVGGFLASGGIQTKLRLLALRDLARRHSRRDPEPRCDPAHGGRGHRRAPHGASGFTQLHLAEERAKRLGPMLLLVQAGERARPPREDST